MSNVHACPAESMFPDVLWLRGSRMCPGPGGNHGATRATKVRVQLEPDRACLPAQS